MQTIEDAIELATKAHKGQVDKAHKPYILHPLRVMLSMDTEKEMIVAILHDVIEDTNVTLNQLKKMGYDNEIIEAISLLTHEENVEYFDYVLKCKSNAIARKVKLADAMDNKDLKRISDPTKIDFERIEKYSKVIEILKN